ncbi:MAG TPA: peptidylprolyl isomerase [Thermoanaerobaculia bacterium]|nr:peptidylprolyl isomerase [Thermoanaerobaculia bacterium]
MMRSIACLLLLAAPVFAQDDASKPVAVINGQTLTAAQLNAFYDGLSPQMRDQYEKAGGKAALLDTYVNQMLITQEARKSGFDHRSDIAAEIDNARDSALFQAYVRDVIASTIVSDAAVRQYYDQHQSQFLTPERAHVRHIFIAVSDTGPHPRNKEQAMELIQKIATELRLANTDTRKISDAENAEQVRISQFAEFARKDSEDAAQSGGDLGWVTKEQLDPDFAAAAWGIPVGVPSGIIETKFGYHIILVEDRKPASVQAFANVKTSIRDALLGAQMNDVMAAVSRLTNDLRAKSKVVEYPQNIQ